MGRELPREGEVVEPGNSEHGGVNAFAFQTAVTKDKPLADGPGLLLPKHLDDERACPGWCLAQCSAGCWPTPSTGAGLWTTA